MNKKLLSLLTVSLAAVGSATMTEAVTVSLHSSNQGITSLNVSIIGTTIRIEETWGNDGKGVLAFEDIELDTLYTIEKVIINNSSRDWTSLTNELLDPDNGPFSNDDFDPRPYPDFVPLGFTTSNDRDGLSFGQALEVPRSSSVFSTVIPDELSDARDFLDFTDGTLVNGGIDDFMTYGLRDRRLVDVNQPFLLVQRPNARSSSTDTPEPTFLLGFLALGLLGIGIQQKRS